MKKNQFRNKTVVITGGTSLLSMTLARELAMEKCDVILIGENEEIMKPLVTELSELKKKTGKIDLIISSMDDTEECDDVCNKIKKIKMTIDGLFLNQGLKYFGNKFEDNTPNEINSFIWTSVNKTLILVNKLLPLLRGSKKPAIFSITDFTGNVALPFMSLYSTVMHMQKGFTESLKREFSTDKINVVDINIDFTKTNYDSEAFQTGMKKIGFNFSETEKIAKTIIDGYNSGITSFNIAKSGKKLAFKNTLFKKSLNSKFKKTKSKILNSLSKID